jgi:hypothetical protein
MGAGDDFNIAQARNEINNMNELYNKGELRKAGIKYIEKGVENGTIKETLGRAILGSEQGGEAGLHQITDTRGEQGIRDSSTQGNRQTDGGGNGSQLEEIRRARPSQDQLDKSNNDKLNQAAKGAVTFDSEGIKATIHAFEAYEKSPDAVEGGKAPQDATQTSPTDIRAGMVAGDEFTITQVGTEKNSNTPNTLLQNIDTPSIDWRDRFVVGMGRRSYKRVQRRKRPKPYY